MAALAGQAGSDAAATEQSLTDILKALLSASEKGGDVPEAAAPGPVAESEANAEQSLAEIIKALMQASEGAGVPPADAPPAPAGPNTTASLLEQLQESARSNAVCSLADIILAPCTITD